jgi:hypothetical protein
MSKKEAEMIEGQMKVIVQDPEVRTEQIRRAEERRDKLDAMKIAQTHIETQNMKVDAKGACALADEFLAWLKK